jgi:uncharacterized protein YcaQ
VLHLSNLDARRFHRRALLLDRPAPNINFVLQHLGFAQIDPINVCGRMHDLILRNRVAGYREGDLGLHLHGPREKPLDAAERLAFEHHLPNSNVLAALPLQAWPYLLAAMRRRTRGTSAWSGKLNVHQRLLAKTILKEIASRGPLCSDDIDNDQTEHHGWGTRASLAKTTLHKLFFHGQVLIAKRIGNRRYYDLPERVLPLEQINSSAPSLKETRRWLTLLKLRQRRLVRLSSAELRLVSDCVEPLTVENSLHLYCLREDLPLFDSLESPSRVTLLAPLDPLIYDRRLTRELWRFDYTWEVYTPPARRIRGYYALPVLVGHEIVGHVDPKADRANRSLKVMKRSVRRGYKVDGAVRELAAFLGLT